MRTFLYQSLHEKLDKIAVNAPKEAENIKKEMEIQATFIKESLIDFAKMLEVYALDKDGGAEKIEAGKIINAAYLLNLNLLIVRVLEEVIERDIKCN